MSMVRLCVSKRYRAKPVIAFGGGCPVRSSVCRPSPQSYEAAIGVIGVNSLIALCDDDAAAETHKNAVATEREAQAGHIRAIEDRAHAEIDRAREETKSLQAALRQKEREATNVAARLESALASARGAENLATEYGARAKALEQQLGRMDGLPTALLAAQKSLQAATQREAVLRRKLDGAASVAKIKPATGKRKARAVTGVS